MARLLFIGLLFIAIPAQSEESDFSELTAATGKTARAYYNFYIQLDSDSLAPLLAEDTSFYDPTAQQIFGSQKKSGKTEVLENFKTAYANITKMEIHDASAFFSGNYGIFSSQLDWSFKSGPDQNLVHIKKCHSP